MTGAIYLISECAAINTDSDGKIISAYNSVSDKGWKIRAQKGYF